MRQRFRLAAPVILPGVLSVYGSPAPAPARVAERDSLTGMARVSGVTGVTTLGAHD